MFFTFPSKDEMETIHKLINKIYKNDFFSFSKVLNEFLFNIVTIGKTYLVLIGNDDHSITIFGGSQAQLGCHFILTQDFLNTKTYGLTNIVIEEEKYDDLSSNYKGLLSKFPHYESQEDKYVIYKKNNPGEYGRIINEEEAKEIIVVLEKLLLIQEYVVENDLFEDFDEPVVSTAEFDNNEGIILNFTPLSEFEILDSEFSFLKDNYEFEIRETSINSGELYLGHVYASEAIEVFDKIDDLEIPLIPIFLYGINDKGDLEHMFYTTPYDSRESSFIVAINHFFDKIGLYDTVITDNMFVCEMLTEPLKKHGIEVLFQPGNPYNFFISNYFIEVSEAEGDIEIINEIIDENKADIKEMFKDKKNVLKQFSEYLSLKEEMEENEEVKEKSNDTSSYIS